MGWRWYAPFKWTQACLIKEKGKGLVTDMEDRRNHCLPGRDDSDTPTYEREGEKLANGRDAIERGSATPEHAWGVSADPADRRRNHPGGPTPDRLSPRGTEKLAEDLTYNQIIPYTDRMDYLNAMNNNHAIVLAVEKLMELEIPERAEHLRVIVTELNRVASHLVWFGTYLMDIGALSPFLYAFKDREKILELFNELCGARLTYNYMRVGGVKWDAPDGWLEKVRDLITYLRQQHQVYMDLVAGNEIFQARVKGVGCYDARTAVEYGLSGSNLRCTGVKTGSAQGPPLLHIRPFRF